MKYKMLKFIFKNRDKVAYTYAAILIVLTIIIGTVGSLIALAGLLIMVCVLSAHLVNFFPEYHKDPFPR